MLLNFPSRPRQNEAGIMDWSSTTATENTRGELNIERRLKFVGISVLVRKRQTEATAKLIETAAPSALPL